MKRIISTLVIIMMLMPSLASAATGIETKDEMLSKRLEERNQKMVAYMIEQEKLGKGENACIRFFEENPEYLEEGKLNDFKSLAKTEADVNKEIGVYQICKVNFFTENHERCTIDKEIVFYQDGSCMLDDNVSIGDDDPLYEVHEGIREPINEEKRQVVEELAKINNYLNDLTISADDKAIASNHHAIKSGKDIVYTAEERKIVDEAFLKANDQEVAYTEKERNSIINAFLNSELKESLFLYFKEEKEKNIAKVSLSEKWNY